MPYSEPRRLPLLALLLLAPCCALPEHEAVGVQEFAVPAAALSALQVISHNGAISVAGTPAAQEVQVRVEIRVRGWSEAEARDNLARLEVSREQREGTLILAGKVPEDLDETCSPSFSFAVTAPDRLAARLDSHNGDVTVRGLAGALAVATHNGGVEVRAEPPRLTVATHNGTVVAELGGAGDLSGAITTHNGSVSVAIDRQRSVTVDAATHNGATAAAADYRVERRGEDSLRAVLGSGAGRLQVTTHNGSVVLR